jgi:hypothetical protein
VKLERYNHPITRFPPYNLFFLVSRFWNNQTSIQYLKNKILLLIAMIELKYDINTYPLQFHTILWKIIYTLRLHETYIYISATMAIFVFLILFFKYWIEVWLFQNRLTRKNKLYGGNLVIGWLYFKLENYLINWVGIFIELPVVNNDKGVCHAK